MRVPHFVLIVYALAFPIATRISAADPRPNIVVVFVDDMGWGDFSCFGNTDAKTPNDAYLKTARLESADWMPTAPAQ